MTCLPCVAVVDNSLNNNVYRVSVVVDSSLHPKFHVFAFCGYSRRLSLQKGTAIVVDVLSHPKSKVFRLLAVVVVLAF